jgi:8-oxo-dGTP diphosphatase
LVAAEPEAVFDAAADPQALAGCGLTPPTTGLASSGWFVCQRPAPVAHRKPRPVRVRVLTRDRPREMLAELSERWRWSVNYRETFAPTPAGTLVTAQLSWDAPLSTLVWEFGGRSAALGALRQRVDAVAALALARTRLVVGAAVVESGRVLAGRTPDGEWELPGGKVEPGERPVDAIVREIGEELGVVIDVSGVIADDVPIPGWPGRLRVYAATVKTGRPRPLVHAELRWIGPDDLGELRWRAADQLLLPHLRACLQR